jgi:hypothetical protein
MKNLRTNHPNPERGQHLLHLVKEFVTRFPKLQTQAGAYNKCKFASYTLVLYLRQRGFNARLIHIQDCPRPAYPEPHQRWQNKRRDRWSHYVVGIGRYSIDITARQFDSDLPVPFIETLAKLRQRWTTVETDTFLNGWAQEVLDSKIKI